MFDVIKQFFILGLMSFGGPAAHIGYFHNQFVKKLRWLTEEQFASIVAISHILPGPGSSQVGFAIGYHKAGWLGGLSAFVGFTLPSFVLMVLFAYFGNAFSDNSMMATLIHGLKLLAVVVVADAVLSMFSNFCKTRVTQSLCAATAVTSLLFQSISVQIIAIIIAGIIGFRYLIPHEVTRKKAPSLSMNKSIFLGFLILFGLSFIPFEEDFSRLFFGYFHAGSLVYGGGHVVLPLLQDITSGTLDSDTFLTGYALAQGVPGPMFTLATFLGYNTLEDAPLAGALIATAGVFLPGFLLLTGFKSSWSQVSTHPILMGVTAGINASVVGLLVTALYQPIFVSAVTTPTDIAVVIIGLLALKSFKLSILKLIAVVLSCNFLVTLLNI